MMKLCKPSTSIRGFTLLEVLLAMMIISLALSLLIPCVNVMSKLAHYNYSNEDSIAIQQLRILLAQNEALRSDGFTLYVTLHMQEQTITFHQHRLVKQSGYVIYLKDIDAASFTQEGGCTYVHWTRGDKKKEALLVCE